MEYMHNPVLLEECIKALDIDPTGIYLDGTVGGGGHSRVILSHITDGKLIAIDRDVRGLETARENLAEFGDKAVFVHGNFRYLDSILSSLDVQEIDGALFDFGVSSPQLDMAERGFSYMSDAPLDMRMDADSELTAMDVVNFWPEDMLCEILWKFGEERYARSIARAITDHRSTKTIITTLELVDIIRSAMPATALRERQHPAKRSFQAIRIIVNEELESITEMLDSVCERLKNSGRLATISYHSMEDRIVKNAIKARENGCTCPRDFPVCICGFTQTMKSIGKTITPSQEEIAANPRARSAKLRVAERVKKVT